MSINTLLPLLTSPRSTTSYLKLNYLSRSLLIFLRSPISHNHLASSYNCAAMKTNRDRCHSSTLKSDNRSGKNIKKIERRPRRFDGIDFCLKLRRVVMYNPAGLCTSPSSKRLYQIVWQINPGGREQTEHQSEVVKGDPNPVWNEKYVIDLKRKPVNYADLFLNVEVITYNSVENRCDPGTSGGIGEVLRGRIPFPKELDDKVGGDYELVKCDGTGIKVAGHISLSMKLETYVWKKNR